MNRMKNGMRIITGIVSAQLLAMSLMLGAAALLVDDPAGEIAQAAPASPPASAKGPSRDCKRRGFDPLDLLAI